VELPPIEVPPELELVAPVAPRAVVVNLVNDDPADSKPAAVETSVEPTVGTEKSVASKPTSTGTVTKSKKKDFLKIAPTAIVVATGARHLRNIYVSARPGNPTTLKQQESATVRLGLRERQHVKPKGKERKILQVIIHVQK